MERETGIGPATNSLEVWPTIDNKELMRSWRSSRPLKTIEFKAEPTES